MEFFISGPYAPFSAAFTVLGVLCLFEALALLLVGNGFSSLTDALVDTESFAETAFTNWLFVRGLPLSVVVVLLLLGFSLAGYLVQGLSEFVAATNLPAYAAVPAALVLGWVFMRLAGTLVLPLFATTTTAVSADTFIGTRVKTLWPMCSRDEPSEVQVCDSFGVTHKFMAVPEDSALAYPEGTEVELVSRLGPALFAVRATQPAQASAPAA